MAVKYCVIGRDYFIVKHEEVFKVLCDVCNVHLEDFGTHWCAYDRDVQKYNGNIAFAVEFVDIWEKIIDYCEKKINKYGFFFQSYDTEEEAQKVLNSLNW